MNISDYILKDFKPLTLQSTVKKAQKQCKNFPITHIPIVEDGKLLGSFSQSDLQPLENKELKLAEIYDLMLHFSTNSSETILELLQLFADNDANIIPVVDQNIYQGYYELGDILDVFSSTPFLTNEGFILEVEKNAKEYSMSEVSQIIESNNATLLGCFISNKTLDKIGVTVKIASQEINDIIQTFRRYNYTIITNHEDDFYLEELKSRSDYLQKFLNT